jgi:transitional endoplasmic reticulum ATPase
MFFGSSHVTENVVNTLLAEMDGLEDLHDVVVIGATNRPDIIDPALLRPGRFDRLLLTDTPDIESRLEIFKIHTQNMPLAKDVNIKALSEKTEGYVGSDIESICREAAMLALREDMKAKEVKKKHFDEAMTKVKLSVPKDAMDRYKSIEEEYLRNAKAALREKTPSYMG